MKIKSDLQALVIIFDLNKMGVTANEDMFPFLKIKTKFICGLSKFSQPILKSTK